MITIVTTATRRTKFLTGMVALFSFFLLAGSVLAAVPQVSTLPATATETTITLNGNFTGGGTGTTQVRFEWGTTPLLGTFTTYQNFAASSQSFSATLTNLTPDTTYYFRAEGINGDGPGFGSIFNKATLAYTLPQAQTLPPTNLSSTTANVSGWYQSDTSATVAIEYANNNQFIGSYLSTPISKGAGSGSYNAALSNLIPNTTYWYRATTTNSGGTKTATTTMSFKTTSAGGTGTTGTGTTGTTGTTTGGTTTGGTTGTTSGTGGTTTGSTGGTSGGTTGGTTGGTFPCSINSFYASPSAITVGNTTNLYWSLSNCSYVTITGPGINNGIFYPGTNFTTTSPIYSSGTYYMTAYGLSGGSTLATTSISLNTTPVPQNNCVISNFYASPSQVQLGNATTLYWNTANCSYVNISGSNVNLQNYPANGSYTVTPTTSGTYFLTASGNNGSAQSQVYVQTTNNYQPPQPTTYACNDGIDNDGDGRIDGNDPGCSSSVDNSEYNAPVVVYQGGTTGGTTTGGTTGGSTVLDFTSSVTAGNYRVSNNLAGLALWGGTILPTSMMGILIVILIILGIILLARRINRPENEFDGYREH